MIALETGWTPDVLAALPMRFLQKCRWALYARAIAGADGFPDTTIPMHAPPDVKHDMLALRREVETRRALLFPEDDDGNA